MKHYQTMDKKRKRRSRPLLIFRGDDKEFTIDKNDFLVVKEMLLRSRIPDAEIESTVQEIVETDDEYRVTWIIDSFIDTGSNKILSLPNSIGKLIHLRNLVLSHSELTCLPASIGELRNLERLYISQFNSNSNLTLLPKEIWDLDNLVELSIMASGLVSLPSSIGKLQNLEQLDLSGSRTLLHLPEEVWSLKSLERLYVMSSQIASLPSAIIAL